MKKNHAARDSGLHTDLHEIRELYVRSRSTTLKYGIGVTAWLDDG